MKSVLVSSLLLLFLIPGITSAAPCYFDCEEVPTAERVLYHFGTAKKKKLRSKQVKMLIWNVYKGKKSEFRPVFAGLVRTIQPDVVVLEEATLDQKVLPALEDMKLFAWDLSANFLMRGGIPTGPAIGSAVVSARVRYHRTEDLEPFVDTPKTTLFSEFPIEGSNQTLLVAGIHAINFTSDYVFEKQLTEVARQFAVHKGPIVFAGDFNVWSRSRQEISEIIADANGLVRAPWEYDTITSVFPLDDAFTRGVTIETAQMWSADVEGIGSDHPALYLKFSLPH